MVHVRLDGMRDDVATCLRLAGGCAVSEKTLVRINGLSFQVALVKHGGGMNGLAISRAWYMPGHRRLKSLIALRLRCSDAIHHCVANDEIGRTYVMTGRTGQKAPSKRVRRNTPRSMPGY